MSKFYIENFTDFEQALSILDTNQISYDIDESRLICVDETDVCPTLEAFDKEDIYYLEAC
ncbi:hypothetical protein FMM80_27620 [Schaedlerella arabinosiphila]|uniref:Uncharacterized protein n=1 Tax=Schaedlerella arabinosiphila TaxID=2044587 RepID=A0A9X5CCV9_9FIRM|nr:hypothetical protein [Schaedlerella arabinosiphila]KAI4440144.1 hypothetical protein C824_002633 [Schaedlerella arabinosiphila]NDO72197.1 hypothetical protein [Schaedlerella arabinosiphila]